MYTKVFPNPATDSLRALVADHLSCVEWRHHGIGVLQGYIRENVEPEVRIHIWSRRLLKPGMDLSGDVHDHRFDMVSHVLVGTVWHEELIERENPQGDHTMMALTHARAAEATKFHGPTTALQGRYSVWRERFAIPAGWSYSFPALKFHRSPLPEDDVAVTVVEKHSQRDDPARLLYPIEREPVMAFGHDFDRELTGLVLAEAKVRLG